MLYINCPHCGEHRDESEFVYAGEAYIPRPQEPDKVTDTEWGDYLFCRRNPKGEQFEQWQHVHGCRKLFVVKRHTVTNDILATGTLAELRADWQQTLTAVFDSGSSATPLLCENTTKKAGVRK